MDVWRILLVFCGLFTGSLGFIGEIFDYIEDLPLRFTSGTCYFLIGKHYREGEFEISISFSKPTVDLYSANFVSYDKSYHGLSYKVINLNQLKPGIQAVKFTVGYFGSYFHGPRAWCRKITESGTTTQAPVTSPSTETTTTPIVSESTEATTTTTATEPSTTSPSTEASTTQAPALSDIPNTPTVPSGTTTTISVTSTLQTQPPRPSPSK